MTTYAELITAKSAETLRDELLERLTDAGFPVTAWPSGGNARTLVQVDVETLAELYELVVAVGKGWSLDDAEGDWLTLHAYSRFNLERILATYAKHEFEFTVDAGAGPYTLTPGQLIVAYGGLLFRSTNEINVDLTDAAPETIEVQCETAGESGNNTPTALVTPAMAGVTMTWQSRTLTARSKETDPALRQRCRDRWPSLALASGNGPQGAYRFLLVNAVDDAGVSCGITRVAFEPVPGDGTVPIWVSGATGNITGDQIIAARTYVDLWRPFSDDPEINHATEVTVTITGTVTFKAGRNTSANRQAVTDAIDAYFSGLEISNDDEATIVDEAQIRGAITNAVPGAFRDIDISPTTDTVLAPGEVAIPDHSGLTFA